MNNQRTHALNQTNLQQVWDTIHQQRPSSLQPEKGVVSFAERLQKQLPVGASVLDIGCGRGRNTRYLTELGFTTHGCDWSFSALAVAKSHSRPEDLTLFSAANLTQLPFANNYFAAIVCVHVLPYLFLANIRQGLREMRRVLRQGGCLYVDFLDKTDPEYGCGTMLEKHTFLDEDGVPMHFSSRNEIEQLFRDLQIQQQTRYELGRRMVWEIWARK